MADPRESWPVGARLRPWQVDPDRAWQVAVFVYNVLAVALAAGLQYPFTDWLLSPMFAALVMSLNVASVIANALRLRGASLRRQVRSNRFGPETCLRDARLERRSTRRHVPDRRRSRNGPKPPGRRFASVRARAAGALRGRPGVGRRRGSGTGGTCGSTRRRGTRCGGVSVGRRGRGRSASCIGCVPPADGNRTALFAAGDRVKLRIVNAAATTIFVFRIPGLRLSVVAADGQDIHPVTGDELRISVAEIYDVIVAPDVETAYTMFAQSIGRTGFVRGTLAPREAMTAPVPAMDEPKWLDMVDMMGAKSGDMSGMQHGGSAVGTQGSSMPGMQHDMPIGTPLAMRRASTEYGPLVDNRVDTLRTNLDDPGLICATTAGMC
jgi:hypothetical protein